MEAMRDLPSVCNHLHLPAQSGADTVLRRMRRGYTRAKYMTRIAFLRGAGHTIELIEYGATDSIFIKPTRKETEDYITGRFG